MVFRWSIRNSSTDTSTNWHAQFLSKGPRYQFLFHLDITDYRGWALGLKRAGYATDPSYANRLIAIIEQYELYKYDSSNYKEHRRHHRSESEQQQPIYKHNLLLANDIAYVVARNGDTYEALSEEFGISARKLAKYNDVQRDYTLQPGDIVYLHKKQRHAAKGCIVHVFQCEVSHTLVDVTVRLLTLLVQFLLIASGSHTLFIFLRGLVKFLQVGSFQVDHLCQLLVKRRAAYFPVMETEKFPLQKLRNSFNP